MTEKPIASFPDIPTTETIQTQGPNPNIVGTRYAVVERIEVMQRLPAGPVGPTGPTGEVGEAGAAWQTGDGDPNDNGTVSTGPNDMYLDEETGEIWFWDEVSGSWTNTGGDILGPTGPQGLQGPTGATGMQGPTGMQGGGILIYGIYGGTGNEEPGHDGQPGEGWVDAAGNLWVWIEPYGWENLGPFVGPTGPPGSGMDYRTHDFGFVVDSGNPVWAKQTLTHNLANPQPIVRILIDYLGNGVYTEDQTVHYEYPSATTVLLIAEASIAQYNWGRGKVIIQ